MRYVRLSTVLLMGAAVVVESVPLCIIAPALIVGDAWVFAAEGGRTPTWLRRQYNDAKERPRKSDVR